MTAHVERTDFGRANGQPISKFTITNENQTKVGILTLAGIIQEFSIVKDGRRQNLVVHYDGAEDYAQNVFQLCKQIGRVAGRIKDGSFELEGQTCKVTPNENGNVLHGGAHGLSTKVLDGRIDGGDVVLAITLKHEDDEFPGNIDLEIRYHLDDYDKLTMSYTAKANGATVFDPTLHIYWQLPEGLEGAKFMIPEGQRMAVDGEKLPTGQADPDPDGIYDFTREKDLAQAVSRLRDKTANREFDEIYRVKPDMDQPIAVLEPESGLKINIFSDRNGLIIFTADPQHPSKEDAGVYDALATEAQTVSDALHHPDFGEIRMADGDVKTVKIAYQPQLD